MYASTDTSHSIETIIEIYFSKLKPAFQTLPNGGKKNNESNMEPCSPVRATVSVRVNLLPSLLCVCIYYRNQVIHDAFVLKN